MAMRWWQDWLADPSVDSVLVLPCPSALTVCRLGCRSAVLLAGCHSLQESDGYTAIDYNDNQTRMDAAVPNVLLMLFTVF